MLTTSTTRNQQFALGGKKDAGGSGPRPLAPHSLDTFPGFIFVLQPDAAGYRLLQSTSGAWTDAPGRRASGKDPTAQGPRAFLSIEPRNSVVRGENGVETCDMVDTRKGSKNQGFPANPMKPGWGRSSVG